MRRIVGCSMISITLVNPSLHLALRPATAADLDLLDAMHTLCMREHVERLYPWMPDLFRRTYDPHLTHVITSDGRDVGMLKVAEEPGMIHLRIIIIFPGFQGEGIGTVVLRRLLERARERHLPVRLQVLRGNPARGLYERLGFREVELTATHHIMIATV